MEQRPDLHLSGEPLSQESSGPEESKDDSDDAMCETREDQHVRMATKDICGAVSNDMCWEHPTLKGVVMVRGHGPCGVDCRNERGEPLTKEVVVSRKCAEAVLRGANVWCSEFFFLRFTYFL